MMRELSGSRGAVTPANGSSGASTQSSAGPTPGESFAALDAGGASGRPTWVHAGARQAEAGFRDPSLGWVSVKADMGGGGIHAQIVPGSADAAEALGSQMAGLHTYLAEHHSAVETLTLSSADGGRAGDQGAGEAMQQGAGQQSGQEMAQGAGAVTAPGQATERATPAAEVLESPALPGGVHISVMA
jgi:hypothetical protein